MDVKLMKSEEKFALHIDGDNAIDATLLSNILKNMATLTKLAAQEVEPEAYLKMNVTAFEKGSFQIDFSAVCELGEDLIHHASEVTQLASVMIGTVKGFFEIKKFLKGKKAEKIEPVEKGKIQLTDNEGQSIVVNESSGAVINNYNIDNLVVNISNDISSNGKGFSFNTSSGQSYYNTEDLQEIRKPIAIEDTYCKKSTINADLLIKKADLLGNSAWSFKYNDKTIEARITDDNFLSSIKNGESIHAGDYITAKLEIMVDLGKDGLPLHNTAKYTVLKVEGGIKSGYKDMVSFLK
jgi:hypothetical protein